MVKSQLEIERSLIKTYKKRIWTKFIRAIKEYELVEKGDKIAVAISGGKDSLTLAKLFQELKKHKKFDFDLEFIAMDPGYKKKNLEFRSRFTSQIFSKFQRELRERILATCVLVCVGEISMPRLRSLVATSLPSDITSTMS